MTRSALIATHLEDRHTGLVRDSLERAGRPIIEWNPLDEAPPPRLAEISGIVSLGGRMSATEIDRHPFLADEVELMRAALAAGVPILGMCLGAQLLAVAAGGRVSTMGRMYVGWPQLSLLAAGQDDPVFGGLPTGLAVMKWHEDIIEVPAGTVVLGTTAGELGAASTPGASLFRIGPAAWGSQMHLELTPPMLLGGWLSDPEAEVEIEAAGYDFAAIRAESERRLEAQMAASRSVFSRFAGLLLAPGEPGPAALVGAG